MPVWNHQKLSITEKSKDKTEKLIWNFVRLELLIKPACQTLQKPWSSGKWLSGKSWVTPDSLNVSSNRIVKASAHDKQDDLKPH